MENKENGLMTGIEMAVLFDQPVSEAHYLSPGGFEMKFADGKEIRFDFQNCSWAVCAENPAMVTFVMEGVDIFAFSEAPYFTMESIRSASQLVDVSVFTGEKDESEVIVKSIAYIRFLFDHVTVPCPHKLIEEYNDKLCVAHNVLPVTEEECIKLCNVQPLGNSFYIEWSRLDEMLEQWVRKEFGPFGVHAEGDRDETECSVSISCVWADEKAKFVEVVAKYARDEEWLKDVYWPEDELNGFLLLPSCFTPPIVESITGLKCNYAVATSSGVYFFEKEREY